MQKKNDLRPECNLGHGLASLHFQQRGFTLIELVLVIIVVTILSAIALPRLAGNSGFEDRGFYDDTIAALRFAQKTAIAQRRLVCVTFSAKTMTVKIASTNPPAVANQCDTDITGPNGSRPYVLDSTSSATDAKYRNTDLQYSPVPADVLFSASGRPNASSSISIVNNFTGAPQPFPLAITVESETGYVH